MDQPEEEQQIPTFQDVQDAITWVRIDDILQGKYTDEQVGIRGWIYRTRSSGKLVFATIRDATGVIQATSFKKGMVSDEFKNAKKALVESSVEIFGKAVADKRAPGGFEVQVINFNLVHSAEVFPITKDQSEEFLLDNRHLWLRSRKMTHIMRIKASLLRAAREWFDQNQFFETTPPIITQNACEGGSTLFTLKYFDKKAFLSQSAQLYLESLIFSMERVWALTPSFRAEKSRTTRHLAEYWHLEGEQAWMDNEQNMWVQEELVAHMLHRVAEWNAGDLEALERDPAELASISTPFEKITYDQAIDRLKEKGVEIAWGDDFGTNEEYVLTENLTQPIFIYNFPKECKAFYMKEDPDNPQYYKCADLLAPEGYGEIIGGSERETDVNMLIERLQEENIPMENYAWYLDLRKYGSVPHSGFGLGIERIVRWVCKLEHIRDTIPYPRDMRRAYP